MKLLSLLVIVSFMLLSCSKYLSETGNYKIKTISGDTATFYKVKGRYLLPGKGLYPDTTIHLKKTIWYNKVNVFLLKP